MSEKLMKKTPADNRILILEAIAKLPDEAFGYIVLACCELRDQYAGNGGFLPESREGFKALGAAADKYVEDRT